MRRVCTSILIFLAVLHNFKIKDSLAFASVATAIHKTNLQRRTARLATTANDWSTLLEHFAGDFDNYHQVVQDRKEGRLPREGGGHEHIHCTLIPLGEEAPNARLAAFYFDGMPERIFRFRHYEFLLDQNTNSTINNSSSHSLEMVLHMLHPELESQLRQESDPTKWPHIFLESPIQPKLKELPKCNVQWTVEMDPIQHRYALLVENMDKGSERPSHHAVMVHGQAILNSSMIPGTKVLVKDQLSLWKDEFWIHDRGYDPDTGDFVYGNQRGIPYRLERVTEIHGNNNHERRVVNAALQWTLGDEWRTPEEYQACMALIGGVSTKQNQPMGGSSGGSGRDDSSSSSS